MHAEHDRERGISCWTKNYRTGIEFDDPEALGREYVYFDPIYTLPEEGQAWWREEVANGLPDVRWVEPPAPVEASSGRHRGAERGRTRVGLSPSARERRLLACGHDPAAPCRRRADRTVGGDPDATFEKFAHDVRTIRASFPKAQLYLFPELYLAGEMPFRTHVPVAKNRHRVPGPLTERIGAVARRARRGSRRARSKRRGVGPTTRRCSSRPTGRSSRPTASSSRGCRSRPRIRFGAATRRPGPHRQGRHADLLRRLVPEVPRSLAMRGAEVLLHPTLTSTPDREEEVVLARSNASPTSAT